MMLVEGVNVSEVWLSLAKGALGARKGEISPAVVAIGPLSNHDPEAIQVRQRVNEALESMGASRIDTVANTIFPASIWKLARGNRERFYELYCTALPRIRAAERQLNRGGVYFERLIQWGEGPCDGNQLEFIISQHRKGRRRTAYQASIFDPVRDHSRAPRQAFPCLQHLSFLPGSEGLSMNAFYATQRIFDKAYGNYLGLSHLGQFMADALNTCLVRLTCYVGVAKLGVNKNDRALRRVLRASS